MRYVCWQYTFSFSLTVCTSIQYIWGEFILLLCINAETRIIWNEHRTYSIKFTLFVNWFAIFKRELSSLVYYRINYVAIQFILRLFSCMGYAMASTAEMHKRSKVVRKEVDQYMWTILRYINDILDLFEALISLSNLFF